MCLIIVMFLEQKVTYKELIKYVHLHEDVEEMDEYILIILTSALDEVE